MIKTITKSIRDLFKVAKTFLKKEEAIANKYDHVLIMVDDYNKLKQNEVCRYRISSLTQGSCMGTCTIQDSTWFALKWLNAAGGMEKLIQICNKWSISPYMVMRGFLARGCTYRGDLTKLNPSRYYDAITLSYMDWYLNQSKRLGIKLEVWQDKLMIIVSSHINGGVTNSHVTSGNLITPELLDRVSQLNELFKDKVIDDININGEERGYWSHEDVIECIRSALYSKKFEIICTNIFLDNDNVIQFIGHKEIKND